MTNDDHRDAAPASISPHSKRSFFKRLFDTSAGRARALSRTDGRSARHAISLAHALMSERGEVSGARLAREALAAYQALGPAASGAFFDLLVKEFSPDPEVVGRCADAYRDNTSQTNLILLLQAAEPARQELFRRL